MLRCASAAFARRAWLLALVSLTACQSGSKGSKRASEKAGATPATDVTSTVVSEGEGGALSPCPEAAEDPSPVGAAVEPCPEPVEPTCEAPIPVWVAGRPQRTMCPDAAVAAGLTLVDLSDDWAPRVLGGDASLGPVPYRERYVRIAKEDYGDDDTWFRARSDRYHELYGIFPTPAVVAARLADDERHACHGAVARTGLETIDRGIDTWRSVAKQRGDLFWRTACTTS